MFEPLFTFCISISRIQSGCMNQLCGSRSSPTWLRARLSATCVWWTCTPSAVFPPMPAGSLTPSSDQELLWAQLKIFPTGNQNCHGICAFILHFIHFSHCGQYTLTLITLSVGEATCLGFTMGMNQDWPVECCRQRRFPFVSVSEENSRWVMSRNDPYGIQTILFTQLQLKQEKKNPKGKLQ